MKFRTRQGGALKNTVDCQFRSLASHTLERGGTRDRPSLTKTAVLTQPALTLPANTVTQTDVFTVAVTLAANFSIVT